AASLAAEKPAPGDKRLETLRADILRFLAGAEGGPRAEACLGLLLRLPPAAEKPPAPPRFPFSEAAARRYQKEYAAALGLPVEFTNGQGVTRALVPPGTFLMGSPKEERGHNLSGYDESPQHEVTLTQPFYLGKHEVTVKQFRAFVTAMKYVTDGEKTGG